MEHEQDTVLQLQEVIEQLRNVFPSEPGELAWAAQIIAAAEAPLRRNVCLSITRRRVRDGEESKYVLLWVDSWGRDGEIKWHVGGV